MGLHLLNQLGIDSFILEGHCAGKPSLVRHAAQGLPLVVDQGEARALCAPVVQPTAAHERP